MSSLVLLGRKMQRPAAVTLTTGRLLPSARKLFPAAERFGFIILGLALEKESQDSQIHKPLA